MTNSTDSLQLLTPRWFKIPAQVEQHPVINKYRNDLVRFKVAHAGRRSFKTEIAKRTIVACAMGKPKQSLFFGGPTRDQAKRIAWNDLKALSPKWAIAEISDGELWIRYKNGSEIWVIGFDAPARFDGKVWHGGILDEYADMKPDVWTEHVEPALRDTRGWCWFIGVPEGKNHYYDLSIRAGSGELENWADYSWLSEDVMHPEEIAEVKSQLDPRTYRQEYCGSFESYEGRLYCYYDSAIHRFELPVYRALPIMVACDFNVDPCLWELGQDTEKLTYFFDEIKQKQTDVFKMSIECKRRLIELLGSEETARKHKIEFYGDWAGTGRNFNATSSTWQIIKEQFHGWNTDYFLTSNPRIVDRVNSVNSRMRNAAGATRYGHSKRCIELHKDFEMVEMSDLRESKNQAGERTHASDSVGYLIHYRHPVMQRVTGIQYNQ